MNGPVDPRRLVERLAGIEVPPALWERLVALTDLVLEVNETHNLTAVRDRDEFYVKHIADSLRPLAMFSMRGRSVVDVGSGAGFPGLVLALATNAKVSLIESVGKKSAFLTHAVATFSLRNVRVFPGRAEEYGRKALREKFDFALCRAFGPAGYCLENLVPLVSVGGKVLLMEGVSSRFTSAVLGIAHELGGGEIDEHPYELDVHGKRCLVAVTKTSPTPARYPRTNSAMHKRPLDPAEAVPRTPKQSLP